MSSSSVRWLLALITLGGIGIAAWWYFQRPNQIDAALLELNNRGIGLMEKFEYEAAGSVFEEITNKAPHWTPGHINLGIALLNQHESKESAERAISIFQQVLKGDPKNNHADFCLGVLLWHLGDMKPAAAHFEAVSKRDPEDAHTWYFLGLVHNQLAQDEQSLPCLEKALKLDPYLPGAFNALQLLYRRKGDDKRGDELLAKMRGLQDSGWISYADKKYGEMGKYAEVIGWHPRDVTPRSAPLPVFMPDASFRVALAEGVKWTTAQDAGAGAAADLCRTVRPRFGGTMVVLDADGDGKLDVFLASATLRDGKLHDLLLRNEGNGKFVDIHDFVPRKFVDVTEAAGLAGLPASVGCCAADYDNDGRADLLLTGALGVRLLRNVGEGKKARFQDVTKIAGIDADAQASFGAALLDIDQDSDLDIVVEKAGKLALYLNIGEAVVQDSEKTTTPLATKFRRADELLPKLNLTVASVAVSDLDSDRDIDVLAVGEGVPAVVRNDRLLKFHVAELSEKAKAVWNGAAILDVNRDEKSDILLVGKDQKASLWVQGKRDEDGGFAPGISNAPALLQAQAVDLDLDGSCDVVGLSADGKPVFLHNQAGKLVWVREALGTDLGWPKDVAAVVASDIDNVCKLDVLVWSESQGLSLYRNQGNGNQGLPATVTGIRYQAKHMRCSADGIGTRVSAQVRDHWTSVEVATFHAGLGQSRQPILLGLGKFAHADFVSLRWPDGVWQAELNLPACQHAVLRETYRKPISCPVLFTWDGTGYTFVTDFIGAGTIGEPLPGGGFRAPRPEESLAIEATQLKPKDGRYVMKITEPMDEATYLDRLQLVVVDHPAGLRVYPDERFPTEKNGPTQDLLIFAREQQIFPVAAKDHRGRDVTKTLREWDRSTVDGFAKRAWIGWAEEHAVELDFGAQLSKFGPKDRIGLFLAGWTDYPYPESIFAADQAGFALLPPTLERLGENGTWQPIAADLSFPAGLPRMMTYDVTGLLGGASCRLRIRTNMHVYWDQIFAAAIEERVVAGGGASAKPPSEVRSRVTVLDVHAARVDQRGCNQEYSPDGKEPTIYSYDRLDPAPVTRLQGNLTRIGDVTELLDERDDRFVIFGPGDEVTVSFRADQLPALPAGWTRSFVLRTAGYCKDASPFTAHGGTVGPLPFQAMTNFPYGPGQRYPTTPRHEDYLRRFNTRVVGPANR